ncbi:hypothetical protein TARUN_8508 [Trichoderma arundinaceum]|uniref:Uncharacterized protein n=1 Tax=Trichoderma arundinaceum TaxID=490622 RepID=A0A395NCB5_TRIAR|nr:hypothetical protein TARUN_8508 [Trichoderma arundinaceum]
MPCLRSRYTYLAAPPLPRARGERDKIFSRSRFFFFLSSLRAETRTDAFLASLPPAPFPFFHTSLTPYSNQSLSLLLLPLPLLLPCYLSTAILVLESPPCAAPSETRIDNALQTIAFYEPYPARQTMSLVDHHDFIPHSQALEGQDHTQRLSYRRSFRSSSAPPSTTTTTTTDIAMAQFDIAMSPASKTEAVLAKAPALPPRSALRASRLLATMPQKLSEHRPVLTPAAPHLLYLSSEEDVSSSADDFSDCDYSSDSERAQETPEQQSTCQDIARMVSVVFSGKPCIVELSRRSISPSSSSDCATSELTRTSTEPNLKNRKGSACSTSSANMVLQHPPRSSSMMSPINFDRSSHAFLNIDPFASKAEPEEPEQPEPQLRKTAAMFKRTLSLVRKRSRPNLNPSASHSREALSIQTSPMEQLGEDKAENHMSTPRFSTIPKAPLAYQETMASRRASSYSATTLSPVSDASSPLSPTKRIRQGFLTRRRSIRV